jgi:hypothetical protein
MDRSCGSVLVCWGWAVAELLGVPGLPSLPYPIGLTLRVAICGMSIVFDASGGCVAGSDVASVPYFSLLRGRAITTTGEWTFVDVGFRAPG